MLNHVNLMGRLTKDPEIRRTESGIPVASFSIACDRDFSNKSTGEKETDFFNVVAWRNTAEFISKYFAKGRMIVISGRLQVRSWQDKDGNKRTTTEVIAENCYFGDSKPAESQPYGGQTCAAPSAPAYPQQQQQMQQFAGQDHRSGNYGTSQNYGSYNPGNYEPIYGNDEQLPF